MGGELGLPSKHNTDAVRIGTASRGALDAAAAFKFSGDPKRVST
jgi:hypothetical protein